MNRIVVTGPESTGKTQLAKALAAHYEGYYLPEYARTYVENLERPYGEDDILKIAEYQLKQYREAPSDSPFVFMDTWLIITKVWMEIVFKKSVEWLENAIHDYPVDLYLLCAADIPWEADPVRENGGEMRDILFTKYESELLKNNCRYVLIKGLEEDRLNNAIFAIDQYLNTRKK